MIKTNLRQLLRDRNMNQAELSKITQIRPSTISDLCNNVSERIKFSHLESICKALKCNISDVLKLF